jgi:hypothetical protein
VTDAHPISRFPVPDLAKMPEDIRNRILAVQARQRPAHHRGQEKALEAHFNRGFAYNYVAKVADKVAREGLIEIDRTQIEQRIAFTRENYRMMREELLKIVYWTPADHEEGKPRPLARDRIEAAKSVVMMDLALLQAETMAGIYKKPIEVLAREIHYEPLPPEIRLAIIAAWMRGGMLPRATVERMVPATAT